MRILVITKYAWDNRISSGNTLTNLFSEWPDTVFYTLYCRDAYPNNNCCKEYYSVSPINLLRNIITPWRIGRRFTLNEQVKNDNEEVRNTFSREVSLTQLSKKHNSLLLLYDLLYSSRIWLNKKLKAFIEEANPDIVFCFGVPDAFNKHVIQYVKAQKHIPIVSYYVDNHYSVNPHFMCIYKRIMNRRLVELASLSSKRYCISQMMCDWYCEIMQMSFELLTKGCEICDTVQKDNNPLRIVYAGNLLFGRAATISRLVSTLRTINQDSCRNCLLEVYTSSYLSEEIKSGLNVEGTSVLFPPRPYEDIKRILQEADIVLHVESFEQKQIAAVRYSFSTKITDCLQSGSMVMAIGPDSVASIDFLSKVPGAVVVSDIEKLDYEIRVLLCNPKHIFINARETNDYARKMFSIHYVHQRLQRDFNRLIQR